MNQRLLPDFDAVIFDMDGLVLDTEPTYAYAWKRAAAGLGVELGSDFLHSLFGQQAEDVRQALAQKIGSRYDLAQFHELAEAQWYAHVQAHGIATMPGLEQVLSVLESSAIPYALATNSASRYAGECLRRARVVHRFPVIVCRDQVSQGKPAPDVFLEAASRMGTPIEACLILEDSRTGLLAAREAKALPILVSSQPVSADLRELALAVLSSLSDVASELTGSHANHRQCEACSESRVPDRIQTNTN